MASTVSGIGSSGVTGTTCLSSAAPAVPHVLDVSQGMARGTSYELGNRVKVRAGQELWGKYSITSGTTVWRIPRSDDPGHPLMDATGWYRIDNLWEDGHGLPRPSTLGRAGRRGDVLLELPRRSFRTPPFPGSSAREGPEPP